VLRRASSFVTSRCAMVEKTAKAAKRLGSRPTVRLEKTLAALVLGGSLIVPKCDNGERWGRATKTDEPKKPNG